MGHHLTEDGKFKSDKYDWCPEGFFAIKLTDTVGQRSIRHYVANCNDKELAQDLVAAMKNVEVQEKIEFLETENGSLKKMHEHLHTRIGNLRKDITSAAVRLSTEDIEDEDEDGYIRHGKNTMLLLKESLMRDDNLAAQKP